MRRVLGPQPYPGEPTLAASTPRFGRVAGVHRPRGQGKGVPLGSRIHMGKLVEILLNDDVVRHKWRPNPIVAECGPSAESGSESIWDLSAEVEARGSNL
jgi:hypothetical protein